VDFPLEARNIFTGTHGEIWSKIYLKKKVSQPSTKKNRGVTWATRENR